MAHYELKRTRSELGLDSEKTIPQLEDNLKKHPDIPEDVRQLVQKDLEMKKGCEESLSAAHTISELENALEQCMQELTGKRRKGLEKEITAAKNKLQTKKDVAGRLQRAGNLTSLSNKITKAESEGGLDSEIDQARIDLKNGSDIEERLQSAQTDTELRDAIIRAEDAGYADLLLASQVRKAQERLMQIEKIRLASIAELRNIITEGGACEREQATQKIEKLQQLIRNMEFTHEIKNLKIHIDKARRERGLQEEVAHYTKRLDQKKALVHKMESSETIGDLGHAIKEANEAVDKDKFPLCKGLTRIPINLTIVVSLTPTLAYTH